MSDTLQSGLYAAFAHTFHRRASAVLLDDGARRLTGADILGETEAWAGALASLGVVKGDRIAVQVEKSLDVALLYLASLRIGAVYTPLNTAYRKGEISYFLGDAEPKLFVCEPSQLDTYRDAAMAVGGTIATLDELYALSSNPAPAPATLLTGSDLAAIIYTSGTTGRSKGAMITQSNLVSNARTLGEIWGFTEDDVLVHTLPLYHIHGLFVALNTTLLAGGRVLLQPGFEAGAAIAALPGATVFMGVPTYYTRLLSDARFDRAATAGMRLFVSGSAPLLTETFEAFQARTGHTILERYGMSEAGMICSNPLEGPRIAGAVGPPLPGVEVRVADAEGRPLPRGEIGVLEVRGPNVFAGYWRMPDKTRDEFRGGDFFITGDMATQDEAGYVRIVGRAKDLIICGGLNVYPKEIEDLLDGFDGVDETAVIGLPHPDFGEAVAAAIKLKPGVEAPSAEAVIREAKEQIAGFKVPKAVFFVDELPRNAMGKVQKAALRDRYKDTFTPAAGA